MMINHSMKGLFIMDINKALEFTVLRLWSMKELGEMDSCMEQEQQNGLHKMDKWFKNMSVNINKVKNMDLANIKLKTVRYWEVNGLKENSIQRQIFT